MEKNEFALLRSKMVKEQLKDRGITNEIILSAFEEVARELFVSEDMLAYAYEDRPLPIDLEQTISQPYIVALMTELLCPEPDDKTLEIGTGSGYQTAILAHLGVNLYTVERFSALASRAENILKSLDYKANIKVADGTLGWPEHAPYDKIIVTAAAKEIPMPLIKQLNIGGRMVIPLGGHFDQRLTVVDKISDIEIKEKVVCGCVFVPLVGKYGYKE